MLFRASCNTEGAPQFLGAQVRPPARLTISQLSLQAFESGTGNGKVVLPADLTQQGLHTGGLTGYRSVSDRTVSFSVNFTKI